MNELEKQMAELDAFIKDIQKSAKKSSSYYLTNRVLQAKLKHYKEEKDRLENRIKEEKIKR